jgi:hypothetical protein
MDVSRKRSLARVEPIGVTLSGDDGFGLQKFSQSENAAFAADARLLEASKWRERVKIQRIDQYPTGL